MIVKLTMNVNDERKKNMLRDIRERILILLINEMMMTN